MTKQTRYSDEELTLFKIQIELKLSKATNDLEFLQDQIQNAAEARDDKGDWMDDIAVGNDLEMLHSMAHRQRRHIQDLENALLRIRNKSYGVCVLTGELIDKRRLMAVPTTTKSLAAKTAAAAPVNKKEERKPQPTRKDQPNKIITRVIRKSTTSVKPPIVEPEEEDELYDDFLDGDSIDDDGLEEGIVFEPFDEDEVGTTY